MLKTFAAREETCGTGVPPVFATDFSRWFRFADGIFSRPMFATDFRRWFRSADGIFSRLQPGFLTPIPPRIRFWVAAEGRAVPHQVPGRALTRSG